MCVACGHGLGLWLVVCILIFGRWLVCGYNFHQNVKQLAVTFFAGADRFGEDIFMMLGRKPPTIINVMWCIVIPILLTVRKICRRVQLYISTFCCLYVYARYVIFFSHPGGFCPLCSRSLFCTLVPF